MPLGKLNKIKRDLKKVYTDESAEIAYDELLQNHKHQKENPAISSQEVFSNPTHRWMYFLGIVFTIFAKFTGVGFFQFYCTAFFDELEGNKPSTADYGVWGYIAIMVTALVGLFTHLVFARNIGRKMSMLIGLFLQIIGLSVCLMGNAWDWHAGIVIVATCVFMFGYGIGLETCGMIFIGELLPACVQPGLGFFAWGINI